MFELFNLQFYLGLIFGGLVVFGIYPYIFKKKEQDLSTFESNLQNIDKAIKDIKKDNDEYQGTLTEKLENFTTSGENFEKIANEMKNTLVAGSSQKQGAWGEMVLEHILTKLQFTEGQEFEKHQNYKTEEGERLIPDFIIHFPGKRDVVIDSKVNLTAWDEYVNTDDIQKKEVDSRFVNLKCILQDEWIFFTNYKSPKACAFEKHKQISALIYWNSINIQIRIKAEIKKTSKTFSDEYFKSRQPEKNALAISSHQSKKVDKFETINNSSHFSFLENTVEVSKLIKT